MFQKNSIVPNCRQLERRPHYVAEFSILAAGSVADYLARPIAGEVVPASWVSGMALIRRLYQLGAFPGNVNTTDENYTSQLFRDKRAAMQMDGSWFANSLPEQNMDTTVVLPFPSYIGETGGVIGGVSMGFYLSRAEHGKTIRNAMRPVRLLAYLSTGENAVTLGRLSVFRPIAGKFPRAD